MGYYITYKYFRAYAYGITSAIDDSIKNYLLRLKSLENAQNAKMRINNNLRSPKSNTSIEYDYSLNVLIASNLNINYKDIFCIFNNLPHQSAFDDESEVIEYLALEINEKDRIKIHRAKRKIIDSIDQKLSHSNSSACLLSYLSSIDYHSFTSAQLDIYIKAIVYLRSTTSFTLLDGTIKNCDWLSIFAIKSSVKKIQLKFLTRFCNDYSLSRNVVERYLNIFAREECFSDDDLASIISSVASQLGITYTKVDFFSDLELIKKYH